ncbi:MAG TPA: glycosyltransferase WbuB [Gammaproteobacteria bacterium]|nr:glycosyltransferase WbuB [Gammaproteobacteria bacterium]
MPKIIFINRFFFPDHSATSQLLSDLAFDIVGISPDILVVTSRQRYDDPESRLERAETINGVKVRRIWTTTFGRGRLLGRVVDYLTFYTSAFWVLLLVVERNDIVVAKTDPPLISVIAAVVVRLRRARLVNWVQDIFPEVASALGVGGIGIFLRVLRGLRNYSLRRAEKNVVLGARMAEKVIEQGIEENSVEIIHNWADGECIKSLPADENPLRAAWGLSHKFVVGYSGNMGRAHDFETIVEAAKLLKGETNIFFLFVGDGARREWLQGRVRELGLNRVMFKPYQARDQLSQSLGVADVHLISLYPQLEGYIVPSKFYGIAAAGRASIFIGDINGEVPEILKLGKCGKAFALGQAQALADYIKELSHDRTTTSETGANARILFEEKFDKGKALAAWHTVLQL